MDRPLPLVFFDIVFREVIAGRIAAGEPLDDLGALWNRIRNGSIRLSPGR